VFGEELPHHLAIPDGWSRSWYVERMPGMELEAGWLFRLIPPGLRIRLAWHADPLPVAWVVEYLQRQLTNMRTSRLQELNAGTSDPLLAGAVPNTEDLQRRLASSQEKAFHVSVYITLVAVSLPALDEGSEKIRAAAPGDSLRAAAVYVPDGRRSSGDPPRKRRPARAPSGSSTRARLVTFFFLGREQRFSRQGGLVVGQKPL